MARVGDRLGKLGDTERFQVAHAFVRRVVVRSKSEIEIHALVPLSEQGQYTHTVWPQAVQVRQ